MATLREPLRRPDQRMFSGEHHGASDVMFILCSENDAALAFLAACKPSIVLQTLGGARDPSDASTRATFDFAVRSNAVRRIVVCGHGDCSAVPFVGANGPSATQADVVTQCQSLREDPVIGALLHDYGVTLRALWIDDGNGDLYACDIEIGTAPVVRKVDVGLMVATLRAQAS